MSTNVMGRLLDVRVLRDGKGEAYPTTTLWTESSCWVQDGCED